MSEFLFVFWVIMIFRFRSKWHHIYVPEDFIYQFQLILSFIAFIYDVFTNILLMLF